MSDPVILGFDGLHTADEVLLNRLRSLQREYLIDLEDACVVEREQDGKAYLKRAVNLTAIGAATGGSRLMGLGYNSRRVFRSHRR